MTNQEIKEAIHTIYNSLRTIEEMLKSHMQYIEALNERIEKLEEKKQMEKLTLQFLKQFVDNKLNQTRCSDEFMWSRVSDYINSQLKELQK